ncbi:MAG: cadherin repeat domain-containing protein, partial [Aequorivita sp.]|nr:cadherin repeat domain-containing protein [Aequorivita sp.]
FAIILLKACSKDSDAPNPFEITVTTSDFSKTMDENPSNGQLIGIVSGSTNEGSVTFSITEQNPAGAFSIDPASGELKVANATLFDF